MFDLLTGIDRVSIFNAPVKSGVSLKPGALVIINNSGEVELADPSARAVPCYICFSDTDEPNVRAAGTVALIYNDMRIKTDNVVAGTYQPGDALTIGTGGKFKKYEAGTDTTPVIAYVEQVLDPTKNILIVRVM